MPPDARRACALVLLLAALAAACGDATGDEPEGATPTAPTTTVPPTTTSVPPGGRQPTTEDPLRVTFAGDSVMAELAPAMNQALEGTGETRTRFLLTPSIARGGASGLVWDQELREFDPDLVVVLVGVWEDRVVGVETTDEPGWADAYQEQVVDPFLDLVTAEGAKVLWIGMAAVEDPPTTERFARLNSVYARVAESREDTDYLAAGQVLGGPDGGFLEVGTSPISGAPVRLRRTDGTHLCPDGVAALGVPVLEAISRQWNVHAVYGWQQGPWREPPQLHAPEECPAAV